MAQKEAKKVGVNFNFKRVANNLQKQYGKKVENAVEKAANNAKQQVNQVRNSNKFKQNQKVANKATFKSVINNIQTQLTAQLEKVPNAQAKKNLIALLDNGAKQAKDRLRSQGLLAKNIKNTVNAKLPEAQNEGAKL